MRFLQKPKKSLGQNFLIDKNIISKITNIINIDEEKTVMEIGAGYGNLTEYIALKKPKKIIAIEKDKNLSLFLEKKFKNYKNIKIINQDILEIFNKKNLDEKIIVFGNLPYNISTKILASLIFLDKWPPWYDCLILMFQKEVAERILAKTKTKEFSRLSVLANWRLDVKKNFDISKNCFSPKPKIDSTVLTFKPKKNNYVMLKNPKNLEIVTRLLFSNRRKMINKNFQKLFQKKISLEKTLDINLNKRPGELSSETYYKIAAYYEKLFS